MDGHLDDRTRSRLPPSFARVVRRQNDPVSGSTADSNHETCGIPSAVLPIPRDIARFHPDLAGLETVSDRYEAGNSEKYRWLFMAPTEERGFACFTDLGDQLRAHPNLF